MRLELYNKFLEESFDLIVDQRKGNAIKSGSLVWRNTQLSVPIVNYIPRFRSDDYCLSFAMQWHRFKSVQLDSKNGHRRSYNQVTKCAKWNLGDLSGKSVLECGCGPGRFTEVFLGAGANVVSVDMSRAVDVNFENNANNEKLLLLQCDITAMPFFYEKFDYVFCYGVLQHTPFPKETFLNLVKYLKPGGKIGIDSYRKLFIPTGWSTPKYIWRPLTKRMDRQKLLKIIEWYIPKYIGFDSLIRSIPKLGVVLTGLIPIPCWNYLNMGYSKEERIQHAIMDTFDALSPFYDNPKTIKEVREWFLNHSQLVNIDVFAGSNGIVGNGVKK